MSSGPYTGANIIVWAISWRENREGDDVENREGDDVGPEAQSCTTPATHQRCTQRQTRFAVSYMPEVRRRHSCPFRSQSSKVRGVASSDFRLQQIPFIPCKTVVEIPSVVRIWKHSVMTCQQYVITHLLDPRDPPQILPTAKAASNEPTPF